MMTLTDDQTMLQDSVAPLMAAEGAIKAQLRHWRDSGCKDGFGHGLWTQFAELDLVSGRRHVYFVLAKTECILKAYPGESFINQHNKLNWVLKK